MILVDTSVWVDHLRHGIPRLGDLLNSGEVGTHPFVIGELACGNLKNRKEILTLFSSLPSVHIASQAEALHLVEAHSLPGTGIGWIDVHLLASALLSRTPLWTRDRKLQTAAKALGIAEKGVKP
jgi:predicted nucleic acid-binding protein